MPSIGKRNIFYFVLIQIRFGCDRLPSDRQNVNDYFLHDTIPCYERFLEKKKTEEFRNPSYHICHSDGWPEYCCPCPSSRSDCSLWGFCKREKTKSRINVKRNVRLPAEFGGVGQKAEFRETRENRMT